MTDLNNQTFWLSEKGVDAVTLVFNFEGFHVLRGIRVQFISPLPEYAILEVSQDFGTTYHPLRYYSRDCERDFDLPDVLPSDVTNTNQLICTSQLSPDGAERQVRLQSGLVESLAWW